MIQIEVLRDFSPFTFLRLLTRWEGDINEFSLLGCVVYAYSHTGGKVRNVFYLTTNPFDGWIDTGDEHGGRLVRAHSIGLNKSLVPYTAPPVAQSIAVGKEPPANVAFDPDAWLKQRAKSFDEVKRIAERYRKGQSIRGTIAPDDKRQLRKPFRWINALWRKVAYR